MSVENGRLGRDSCARGFVRAAQYFANMLSGADLLSESSELVRSIFAPDVVCFCPAEPRNGGIGSGAPGVHAGAAAVLRNAVRPVTEAGLMAREGVGGESPAAYVVLPVTVRGRTESALLVGYAGERELPPHLLEALLGVAALAGATLARQRADRELLVLAEERAARAIAEVTERRARLLSEVSKALFASFDFEAALLSVARLLVPELADWCAVELGDGELGDGEPPEVGRDLAIVHADPSKTELVRELRARPGPDVPRGAARVMATGEPQLHPEIGSSLLPDWTPDPRHLPAA